MFFRQTKSGAASESDNGKASRASSASTVKREVNQISQIKVDESMTAREAILDAIDTFATSDNPEVVLIISISYIFGFSLIYLCEKLKRMILSSLFYVKLLMAKLPKEEGL